MLTFFSLADSIYEEALTTRESYCMSMISAAIALKVAMPTAQYASMEQHKVQQPATLSAGEYEQSPNAESNDNPKFAEPPHQATRATSVSPVAIGIPLSQMTTQTFDWHEPVAPPVECPLPSAATPNDQHHFSESKPSVPKTEDVQPKPHSDENHPPTKPQPEEEYEPADSALTFMVIYLFSLFFSIAFFVAKIPWRIGTLLFKVVVSTVVFRILWLSLEDDNGACEIGACVDHRYNMPGIY
jgi:hypothetical protein